MKNKIKLGIVAAIAAAICVACVSERVTVTPISQVVTNTDGSTITNIVQQTNTVTTLDVTNTAIAVETAVSGAVAGAIIADTNTVPYLRLSQNALAVLAGGTNFTTAALTNAIGSVCGDNDDARIAEQSVQVGIAIFDAYYKKVIAAKIDDKVYWLRPVLQAISDGIDDGLEINGY